MIHVFFVLIVNVANVLMISYCDFQNAVHARAEGYIVPDSDVTITVSPHLPQCRQRVGLCMGL